MNQSPDADFVETTSICLPIWWRGPKVLKDPLGVVYHLPRQNILIGLRLKLVKPERFVW